MAVHQAQFPPHRPSLSSMCISGDPARRPELCSGGPGSGCHNNGEVGRGHMFGILGLGFLLGMQHALEADHIAAVSSIAARRSDISDIVKHGLTWGLGHTLTLFVFAGAAL